MLNSKFMLIAFKTHSEYSGEYYIVAPSKKKMLEYVETLREECKALAFRYYDRGWMQSKVMWGMIEIPSHGEPIGPVRTIIL